MLTRNGLFTFHHLVEQGAGKIDTGTVMTLRGQTIGVIDWNASNRTRNALLPFVLFDDRVNLIIILW
jgi:hypothetical protein